jgi:hypothetical protein
MKFKDWLEHNQVELWLDDERDPNDPLIQKDFHSRPGMVWVKTVPEAKEIIKQGNVSFISFDNDLGQPEEGYDLAKWIEEEAYFKRLPPMEWAVHSQNTEGQRFIIMSMNNATKYWNR